MIVNDEKYKVRSKSANYISCKATQKILKVTRGALNERRQLFSSAIFVVDCRIYETFFTIPKYAGQGLFTYQF